LPEVLERLQAPTLAEPRDWLGWLYLARCLELGQEQAARASFSRAGESRNPKLLSLLAEKLFINNLGAEALQVREAVTQLVPEDAQAWMALGQLQGKLWQIDKAMRSVDKAQALRPGDALLQRLREELVATDHSREQFDRDLACFEADGLASNANWATRLLMQSLYQAHMTADAVADLHRQHPVNVFMLPVLQGHDHAQLEVFIYQTGTMIDEYTRLARACADHWREGAHLDDLALHRLIVQDRLDVLVDLAGHTSTHRLGVFVMGAARVQMSYLGYPHSTGLPCIDWLIADAVVAPPQDERLFTERVARVSGSVFCWHPVDNYPLPPDPVAVSDAPVVFGSFNNLLKMDSETLGVWARILRECPPSRLLLKSAMLADPVVVQKTHERFAREGIAPDRLVLRGQTELSLMMQEYLEVDVALDPFAYNGGTTSLQALWMGCPLVSLQGHNFVSRMGASFLTHLGRPQWLG
jgi:hypothetical protein